MWLQLEKVVLEQMLARETTNVSQPSWVLKHVMYSVFFFVLLTKNVHRFIAKFLPHHSQTRYTYGSLSLPSLFATASVIWAD